MADPHDPRDRGFNGGHARHHDLAQGRDPWERQPHESGKAYACFTLYREMGPITRTLRAVAQETKRDLSLVNRWSSSWQWVFRAEQWDQREAELRAQTLRGQYEAMIKRHRALASAGLALVIQRVVGDPSKGIERLDPNTLKPHQLAYMARVFTLIERLATAPAAPGPKEPLPGGPAGTPDPEAEFVERIVRDPALARAASDLFAALDGEPDGEGPDDAGGLGPFREP